MPQNYFICRCLPLLEKCEKYYHNLIYVQFHFFECTLLFYIGTISWFA